jgi:dihydroorotate dehydrogenase
VGAVVRRARQNAASPGRPAPVLVKLAPDLTDPQIDEAVEIALGEGAEGIVATNTTVARGGLRTPEAEVEGFGLGGISGRPLRERALEVVGRIYQRTDGAVPIVGVGGVMDADDAWSLIRAGASLVQLYTGFVYGGPAIVRRINQGLVRHLRQAGLRSIGAAVGSAHR